MKRNILNQAFFIQILLLCFTFSNFLYGQIAPLQKQWDKTFGGSGVDELSFSVESFDGGYLLGGYSYSNISGDKTENSRGDEDYWIIKIDSLGNKIWDKTFGGSEDDRLNCLISTADGGYMLGGTSRSNISGDKTENSKGIVDYWIVKIDANGNKQWDKTFGGNEIDELISIVVSPEGGYLLGGYSNSDMSGDKSDEGKGSGDFWIVKIDSNGNKIWDKTIGGSNSDGLKSLIHTHDSGYLLSGWSDSNISSDKSENSKGFVDYWIVKIDINGNKLWDKTFGGNDYDELVKAIYTQDDGFILGGFSTSNISGDKSEDNKGGYNDFWLIKIDVNGNKIWDKTLGGNGYDFFLSMVKTQNNEYLLGGYSDSNISGDKSENSKGGTDYWIVKINSFGNKLWDKTLGGSWDESLETILLTKNNEYLLTGWSFSGIGGDKSENSKGVQDYWIVKLSKEILNPNKLSGTVFQDQNGNCIQDTNEKPLSGWTIKAQDAENTYYAVSDTLGKYNLYLDSAAYTITQIPPANGIYQANQFCPNYQITFESLNQDTTGFDFGLQITECAVLKVDVNSNRRRRCFTNQTTITYRNEGIIPAENAKVEVLLPDYVIPLSSDIPWISQNGNTLTFNVGTLSPGEQGIIHLTDSVACIPNITGIAQCTEARISPKNSCVAPDPQWNGASLQIFGECFILFDPVALISIKNSGTANMTTASQYRIFANDSLLFQSTVQLNAGDSLVLEIPTQGQTVRVEANQVPFHPGSPIVSYQTTGDCENNPAVPSQAVPLAMQFPTDDEPFEVEIDCLPIIDSYDPNDKQAHPIGFTENHYVKPGSRLEYTIRFQNTGTAEAVNIEVVDTLSNDLNMESFEMASASHPYTLEIRGGERQTLVFKFKNINLPDSTSNEPESHGFIKFKISPKAGLPEGTIVENFGDIYFDFNEPIRTNTTVSNFTDYQFPQAQNNLQICDLVRKASASENQILCANQSNQVTLTGNTPTFGQGKWKCISGQGTIQSPNNPQTLITQLGTGEIIFEWSFKGSAQCDSSRSQVKITRFASPTQANAGQNKEICTNNYTLQGNTPSTGQGKWTLVSGSATILNINTSNSAIQNIAYGENTFRWSIGNGTCDSTHSTVKIIRLREPTIASAGTDKSICESNYTLQGNTPQYGQGTWTRISGSGNLVNANSPNAGIENLTVGESIFEWKITNGNCTSSQSQVKITKLPAQENTVSIQSNIQAVCAGETITFTATATNGGTNPVFQWKINGQNTGTNSATLTSNQIQNNDIVTVEMQANSTCPSPAKAISNEIKMTIYPKPARPEIQQTKLNLLKSSVSGLNYRWYKDGILLTDAQKDTLQVDELGTYEVEVLGENCISEKSEAFQLDEDALNQFASLRKANVFPNPNEGKFTLQIPNNAGSSVKIALFDSQGKSLLKLEYQSSKLIDFEEEIQTQNLQSGTYLLQIETLQGRETKRVVVR